MSNFSGEIVDSSDFMPMLRLAGRALLFFLSIIYFIFTVDFVYLLNGVEAVYEAY